MRTLIATLRKFWRCCKMGASDLLICVCIAWAIYRLCRRIVLCCKYTIGGDKHGTTGY